MEQTHDNPSQFILYQNENGQIKLDVRFVDVVTAKNYLAEDELRALSNLVEQYLVFAEGQAMRRITMTMIDWVKKLDGFLTLNDRDILNHAGKVSHQMAKQLAEQEYDKYHQRRLTHEACLTDNHLEQLTQKMAEREKKQ